MSKRVMENKITSAMLVTVSLGARREASPLGRYLAEVSSAGSHRSLLKILKVVGFQRRQKS